jgi:excisionase family DNA binding protein
MSDEQVTDAEVADAPSHYTTIETARLLGLAVRSIQLMVDRGELQGWKTPGGHRRITKTSVAEWIVNNQSVLSQGGSSGSGKASGGQARHAPRVLLVEDSAHFQNLVSLVVREYCPDVDFHIADDGIAGLALYGKLQPDVLIVDILLPGIDGATLITSLRSHPQFSRSQLIIVTSLDEQQRAPYAFALSGVPVAHKLKLVEELPPLLQASLAQLKQRDKPAEKAAEK